MVGRAGGLSGGARSGRPAVIVAVLALLAALVAGLTGCSPGVGFSGPDAATPSPGSSATGSSPCSSSGSSPASSFGSSAAGSSAGATGSAAAAAAPDWVASALADNPVWELPGVQVRHADEGAQTGEVAVVSNLPADKGAELSAAGAQALAAVRSAWRRPWNSRLLIVAPADRAQWTRVAGRTGASAATSTGGGETPAPTDEVAPAMTVPGADGSGVVVLDPVAWESATGQGRRALVIHEAVHVAVRADPTGSGAGTQAAEAPQAGAPAWLSEGFAQWVAYEAVGVGPDVVAGDFLAQVRAHGPPEHLPEQADFEGPVSSRLDAYAGAWLACRTLAQRAGAQAPRVAMEAGSVRAAGLDNGALTRAWQADLRRLAEAG